MACGTLASRVVPRNAHKLMTMIAFPWKENHREHRLTQRALDGWWAPRYFGFCLNYEMLPFRELSLGSRQ